MYTKACKSCGDVKAEAEFYAQPTSSDGIAGICKECHKAAMRRNRVQNIERIREYDRRRGARQTPEYRRKYRAANAEKYAAHVLVGNAVRDGQLQKPDACEQCGSTFHIEGHHDDYSKPLEVRWLCAACHKQHHAEMRRQAS